MHNLATLFDSLATPEPSPDSVRRLSAVSIPGYEAHRIAKDHNATPALLLGLAPDASTSPATAIHLEHLEVLSHVHCVVTKPDGSQEASECSIVRCIGESPALHTYFLHIIEGFLSLIGPHPTTHTVQQAFSTLAELFRAMTKPARKTVQGFWAELFVISRSGDVPILVQSWHVEPTDIYDFNAGSQRLEVKSASGEARSHHFSLNQLLEPEGTRVVIASVLVERAGGGVSLRELVERIRTQLTPHPELLLKLDYIVLSTLGDSWRRSFSESFDYEHATTSLCFLSASDIPTVGKDAPYEVSNISFKVDVSGVPELKRSQLKAAGGLFRALVGK
jgi:Putative  PD-(D/E)XK family member, (DUF4420)